MRKLIGNGGVDEEVEKVVEDERQRKGDKKEEKRKKKYRRKKNERIMLGKKKKNEEINFAMLVVASNSRERCKKEYLPCAISFPAHSLIFCTSIDTG